VGIDRRASAPARSHPSRRALHGAGSSGAPHPSSDASCRHTTFPLIINFGAPIRGVPRVGPTRWDAFGSFTTGAYDSYVLVETDAGAGGIQIDFTILGARLFLGNPLNELTNRAVALDDVFGRDGLDLTAALQDAPAWDDRVRSDRFEPIARRMASARPLSREMPLDVGSDRRDRRADFDRLACRRDLGWSRRRLVDRFRKDLGLAPKVLRPVSAVQPRGRNAQGGRAATAERRGARLRLLRPGSLRSRFPRLPPA
jgi:hypothetical protein